MISAIHAANTNGAANTLTLAAGTYTLTAVDNMADGPTGLPSVTSPLTLRGAGASSTVLERAAGAPPFRLLHVAATGALSLDGLTLQGGNVAGLADGGGVLDRGTLTVTHSLLRGHAANNGGGIFHSDLGTLTIRNSMLSGNVASGSGGGIDISTGFNSDLTVTNSTLRGNVASSSGGGIKVSHAKLSITNSTLSGNMAGSNGGGVFSEGGSSVDCSSTALSAATSRVKAGA